MLMASLPYKAYLKKITQRRHKCKKSSPEKIQLYLKISGLWKLLQIKKRSGKVPIITSGGSVARRRILGFRIIYKVGFCRAYSWPSTFCLLSFRSYREKQNKRQEKCKINEGHWPQDKKRNNEFKTEKK